MERLQGRTHYREGNAEMATNDDLEGELVEQMRTEAKHRGIDPSLVQADDVQVEREDSSIHFNWKDVAVTIPAPGKAAVDEWFKENGQAIAGSLMTLAGVVATGALTIVAAAILGSKDNFDV